MPGELIYTVGLPACGKSTWAEAQRVTDPNNIRIVTKDDIRSTFGTSFERGDEPTVHSASRALIRGFLKNGHTVIVADLNLTAKGQRELHDLGTELGVPVRPVDFRRVPVEVCIERNTARWEAGDCKVPNDVIYDLASRYGLPIS